MRRILQFTCVLALFIYLGFFNLASSRPTSGRWMDAGQMIEARTGASAVLLHNGWILITGGMGPDGPLATTEATAPDGVVRAPSMAVARAYHSSVVLNDGRVLVVGGETANGPTRSIEIYDPRANSWTAAQSMSAARSGGHTATVLNDGRVLIAAGGGSAGAPGITLELYDPDAG